VVSNSQILTNFIMDMNVRNNYGFSIFSERFLSSIVCVRLQVTACVNVVWLIVLTTVCCV